MQDQCRLADLRCGVKKIAALVVLAGLVVGVQSAGALSPAEQKIADRLQPVAKVCVKGDPCEAEMGAVAAVAVSSEARSGEAVFNGPCAACHTTGAAGAPKIGDVAAWAARLDKGMDTLVSNAINGIGAMPAKGTCGDCSDEEIAAAVEYMVSQSQ